MIPMAVIAGGNTRRDIRPSQGHRLAVIRVAIVGEPVLVASAATLVADGFEIVPFGIYDFVRGVAVGADRPSRIAFGKQLPVDALIVSFLHAEMAFAAGFRNVGMVDRRIAIYCAFDVMDTMAIVARRSDDQTHFQKGLTVDAVHVLSRGLGMNDLIFLRQAGIAVTFGAREWQI